MLGLSPSNLVGANGAKSGNALAHDHVLGDDPLRKLLGERPGSGRHAGQASSPTTELYDHIFIAPPAWRRGRANDYQVALSLKRLDPIARRAPRDTAPRPLA